MVGLDASDDVLVRAAATNQTAWMARIAEAAGGIVHVEPGITWTSSPAGAMLAFPELTAEQLGELLPRFLEEAERAPEASCWSLVPSAPPELGSMLRAAGFRDGWEAHWMAAASALPIPADPPSGIRIGVAGADWTPTGLPWDGAGIAAVRAVLAESDPREVWHVGAWRGHTPVGHATLNVTTGDLGAGGIYDMGVAPEERRRGIGRALTGYAAELARRRGCDVLTLNATPEGELLYRAVGFRSVGVAQTWWR
jgi:GNAT superfamily N-acetyltransferase